ncbi:thiamine diphosphokinase [Butyrivibrio sp. AE3004]|uniref:thiamine diphosphokinase n=1 Tax=Butyrivibrio sp. AE3004 TaxID=1506994 RepID=UPI000493C7F7|nr:thiamine diphosphokinase [Butyrivibrio sp. AE3004]
MERCVIVGGSAIDNYEFVRKHISKEDYIIYCDCGLAHMEKLKAEPSLIVGDFDSHENPHLETETIVLPRVKDDTDTLYAVKEAIKRGYTDFVLVGVLGKRFDHTLGNLAILLMLEEKGMRGKIIDDFSEITVVSDSCMIKDDCKYFSVLAAGGDAHGVTIKNAKYNAHDMDIDITFPIGVSNEVQRGSSAFVSVREGKVFIIKVYTE